MKTFRSFRTILPLLVLIGGLLATSLPAAAQDLKLTDQVIERELANGLKVLMVPRPQAPLIRCILAYRVGSVNERPGITGISHFLEHMMFKGTRSMGVRPGMLARDLDYIRRIDAIMDLIIEEEARVRGRDEDRIAAWRAEIADLIVRQKEETIIPNELWAAYQEAGGTGINASTGQEMTQYYVTLPKNQIELFLALEADRMVNPVFREFYSERDVVVEERRMSENRPGFFFGEQLQSTFYAASPYSWSVLGWMSDLSRITHQEMIDYHARFYRPDNAVLVLAGDVDVDAVMHLVEKHFGRIPAGGKSPRVRTEEPYPEFYRRTVGPDFEPPHIEKRVYGRAATAPYIQIMFHIPPLWHEDLAPLFMLGQVLGARTGPMYLDLVNRRDWATAVSASASNSMYDGAFTVRASLRERGDRTAVTPQEMERELWRYLEEAKTRPCDPELLQRIKNSVEASFLQSLSGTGIAGPLARMEVAYNWRFLEEQYQQRMAVTPEDIMRVARLYLTRDNSVTGILERER